MLQILVLLLLIVISESQGRSAESSENVAPTKRWRVIGRQDLFSRLKAQDTTTVKNFVPSGLGIRSGEQKAVAESTSNTPFLHQETTRSTLLVEYTSKAPVFQDILRDFNSENVVGFLNVATNALLKNSDTQNTDRRRSDAEHEETAQIVNSNIVADIQEVFKNPQALLSTVIKGATKILAENERLDASHENDGNTKIRTQTTKQPITFNSAATTEAHHEELEITPVPRDLPAKIFKALATNAASILPLLMQAEQIEQTTTTKPQNLQGLDIEGILKMFNIDGSKASIIIEFISKNNIKVFEILRDSNLNLGDVLEIFQTGDFSSKKTQDMLMTIAMQIMMKKGSSNSQTTESSFDASALIKAFMEMTTTTTPTPATAGCKDVESLNGTMIWILTSAYVIFKTGFF